MVRFVLIDEAAKGVVMHEALLEIDPSLFPTQILLGDICLRAGDLTCAIEAYQEALQLQPDDQDVRQKLREVQARTSPSE